MKRKSIFLTLSTLSFCLTSCAKVDPATLEPKDVDFSVYQNNPYITEAGTRYGIKSSDTNYTYLRLSPRGVMFTESRFGKMLWEETPLRAYYLDSETSFHYTQTTGGGGYMINGIYMPTPETTATIIGTFFTNEKNQRCFSLSNLPDLVYVAEN